MTGARSHLGRVIGIPAALVCCVGLLACDDDGIGDQAGPDAGETRPGQDATPDALPQLDLTRYHDHGEISDYLRDVATARPRTVTFHVLGESRQGRSIEYIVIDNTGMVDPPAIYLNGTHHGDEKSATEAPLATSDYLLRNPTDPDVAIILGNYAVYVLPLVNPDGHANDTREDSTGEDPNRDYSHPGQDDSAAFNLVEIQLQKQLQDQVQFRAAVAYHSGIEAVLWPWGWSSIPADHADVFASVSGAACDATRFSRCLQSYHDYQTFGEYLDYAYYKHQTLAVTFECSNAKTPDEGSELATINDRSTTGTIAFMRAVADYDAGMLQVRPAPPPDTLAPSPWVGVRLE